MFSRSLLMASVAGALLAAVALSWRQHAAIARLESHHAAMIAVATQAAREREQTLQKEVEDVRSENQSLRDLVQHHQADAAAAADRLRSQLAAANRRVAAEATRAGRALDENTRIATELRNVLAMCTAEYQRLGAVADGLRSDLMGLQGWANIVLKR